MSDDATPAGYREDDEPEEDEWFGEGSSFGSGDELAAALFAMAGATPPVFDEPAAEAQPSGPVFEEFPRIAAESQAAFATHPQTEWVPIPAHEAAPQVPSPGARPTWTVRQAREAMEASSGAGRQWSIRHGVRMLKMTEDVIDRLRQDAVEITWAAAGIAEGQLTPRRRARRERAKR